MKLKIRQKKLKFKHKKVKIKLKKLMIRKLIEQKLAAKFHEIYNIILGKSLIFSNIIKYL